MILQIKLLLPLYFTALLAEAADSQPAKSTFRCGVEEEDARTACGKLCVYNTDCNAGEFCWSTFPNTCYVNDFPGDTVGPVPTSNPESSISPTFRLRTDFRCGINEEDSRTNCRKVCTSNSECDSGEFCWSTFPNVCYINDLQINPPTDPPIDAPTGCSICGDGKEVGNLSAIVPVDGQEDFTCGNLQLAGAEGKIDECRFVKTLIEEICECRDIPVDPTESPTQAPVEPTESPTKPPEGCSVCGDGKVVGNKDAIFEFEGQPSIRCGLLERVGELGVIPLEQCAFLTSVIAACECQEIDNLPMKSLTDLPTVVLKQDFRCGVDEEDSRTNCGKVCTFNTDCDSGEFCWSTFPNACYINDPPVDTFSTASSQPLGDEYRQSYGILGTAGAGGTCLCPSGIKYVVADNYDGCKSLQCVGGISELFCEDPEKGEDGYFYAGINGKTGWGVVCAPTPVDEYHQSDGILGSSESIPITTSPISIPPATTAPITSTVVQDTILPISISIPLVTSAPDTLAPVTLPPVVSPTLAPVKSNEIITSSPVISLPSLDEYPLKSDYRCGINEEDSRTNCKKVCVYNTDCDVGEGEFCWSTFPNKCYINDFLPDSEVTLPVNSEPRSDFRCGSSEADARGNCKNECVSLDDCVDGELCWPTLPNYCYAK